MDYDYWVTMSDIDYEDSCNTECYDTDEDLEYLLKIIKEEEKRFSEVFLGYKTSE